MHISKGIAKIKKIAYQDFNNFGWLRKKCGGSVKNLKHLSLLGWWE